MARKEDGHDAPVTVGKWSLLPYGTHEPKAEMIRSSGKQAERTAVRAALIVCPEESLWPSAVCGHFAMSARDAASMGSSPALTPEGFQRASGKPFGRVRRREILCGNGGENQGIRGLEEITSCSKSTLPT